MKKPSLSRRASVPAKWASSNPKHRTNTPAPQTNKATSKWKWPRSIRDLARWLRISDFRPTAPDPSLPLFRQGVRLRGIASGAQIRFRTKFFVSFVFFVQGVCMHPLYQKADELSRVAI